MKKIFNFIAICVFVLGIASCTNSRQKTEVANEQVTDTIVCVDSVACDTVLVDSVCIE